MHQILENAEIVSENLKFIDSVLRNPNKLMNFEHSIFLKDKSLFTNEENTIFSKKNVNKIVVNRKNSNKYGSTYTSPDRSTQGKDLFGKKPHQNSKKNPTFLDDERNKHKRDYSAKQKEKMDILRNYMDNNIHNKNKISDSENLKNNINFEEKNNSIEKNTS